MNGQLLPAEQSHNALQAAKLWAETLAGNHLGSQCAQRPWPSVQPSSKQTSFASEVFYIAPD